MIKIEKMPGRYKIVKKNQSGNIVKVDWANSKWRAQQKADNMKRKSDEIIEWAEVDK